MRGMKVAILLAFLAASASGHAAEAPQSLTYHRCYVCHSDQEILVGPAFAAVAASYRGQSGAVTKIANDIRTGIRNGGPWHMPPHPEITPDDARAMARYIMSLAPQQAGTPQAKQPR